MVDLPRTTGQPQTRQLIGKYKMYYIYHSPIMGQFVARYHDENLTHTLKAQPHHMIIKQSPAELFRAIDMKGRRN